MSKVLQAKNSLLWQIHEFVALAAGGSGFMVICVVASKTGVCLFFSLTCYQFHSLIESITLGQLRNRHGSIRGWLHQRAGS
jgi:hypothetical protein